MPTENIAIIDLGTNTFHLMVIAVEGRSYRILDKYKEPVKLGQGGITQGIIGPEAYKRGIKALQKFRKILDTRRVTHIMAFATSAVRGAANAQQFIDEALSASGIAIKIINGYEEAVLIYEGAKNGIQLPGQENVLFVDIGGGSVEFIVGDRKHPKLIRSLNIGGSRLLELLRPHDPMTPEDIARAQAYIADQLEPLLMEIQHFAIRRIVGSSGSFETLGTLVAAAEGKTLTADMVNAYQFGTEAFQQVYTQLIPTSAKERKAMPGMDASRVEMINMGCILVKYLVDHLKIQSILVSSFALKEGILFTWMSEKHAANAHSTLEINVRERAIVALAEKYQYDAPHARQVSALALSLFDQLAGLHHMGADERELLHYAAVLHDIGHFVDRSGHHKHGQYLVMNSRLPGFNSDELMLLGNLIRYHRKSLPSFEHMHYNSLYKEDKHKVMVLGGLLRLAVNLDKAHRALVTRLEVAVKPRAIDVLIKATDEIDIELAAARESTAMLEQAFERKMTLRCQVQQPVS
ncbi:MAG: Ppx/GppA family phosphatase [Bacteroidetes bacterium]|nr:Ppx/GppA family phosphatase [Bacteroidota bacterium]